MNLRTLESVVRRMYADAEFRKQVMADPVGAFSEYRLADEERVAVTKLSLQLAGVSNFGRVGPFSIWF